MKNEKRTECNMCPKQVGHGKIPVMWWSCLPDPSTNITSKKNQRTLCVLENMCRVWSQDFTSIDLIKWDEIHKQVQRWLLKWVRRMTGLVLVTPSHRPQISVNTREFLNGVLHTKLIYYEKDIYDFLVSFLKILKYWGSHLEYEHSGQTLHYWVISPALNTMTWGLTVLLWLA